jgi:hypothetical protein
MKVATIGPWLSSNELTRGIIRKVAKLKYALL